MSVPKLRFPEFRDAGEWEVKICHKLLQLKYSAGAISI